MPPRRALLLLGTGGVLSACGFHLRVAQPLDFDRLYLQAGVGLPFSDALRESLESNSKLTVVRTAKEAQVQLQILTERREQAILSLTTAGQVRELTLRQRVRFQVLDNEGETLLPASDLAVERVLSFNAPNTLSEDSEIQQIYSELQADTVRLLMLRLASLRLKKDEQKSKTPGAAGA